MFLSLTSPMTHGSAVRRVQEWLLAEGYSVGKSGADSWYGKDSANAVSKFQQDRGLPATGVVDDTTFQMLQDVAGQGDIDQAQLIHIPDIDLVIKDFTKLAHPANYRPDRTPITIQGFTLHQTGCLMSSNPAAWRSVNAHVGVTREGSIFLLNDFFDFIWHAQGLSHHTVGIEVSGNMSGIEGDERTYWKPGGGPHAATPEQVAALRKFIPWAIQEIEKRQSTKVQYIHAHRQSSNARVSDPGEKLWETVGLWAIDTLGLSEGGPAWTVGNGLALPREWGGKPSRYTASF
jgi:peptidoglycan hydrolase-like protein with peptidoglycan-binding domain